ncbi:HIG1 domain family member 2A [Petromyzon marinus]|uniref:HIG1 domain family member 2A, mitochondrial n=1 Tax=Petromyzon marinus TaxID=7757 RepID=A0AAJ7WKL4_PETMA|nr:HIG1 domain family member 2A, mitochondrial [Petromyzon marinus]
MAAAPTAAPTAAPAAAPAAASWPLDPSRPPLIEGFTPSGGDLRRTEGFGEKLARKTKENPFVPLGVLTTAVVLSLGLVAFRRGDFVRSQRLMRARVLAQGFTLVALVGGVVLGVGRG